MLQSSPLVGPGPQAQARHGPHVAGKSPPLVLTAAMWDGVAMSSKQGVPFVYELGPQHLCDGNVSHKSMRGHHYKALLQAHLQEPVFQSLLN